MSTQLIALTAADWITPQNPWSLWVPIGLLGFIIMAAVYFVRLTAR